MGTMLMWFVYMVQSTIQAITICIQPNWLFYICNIFLLDVVLFVIHNGILLKAKDTSISTRVNEYAILRGKSVLTMYYGDASDFFVFCLNHFKWMLMHFTTFESHPLVTKAPVFVSLHCHRTSLVIFIACAFAGSSTWIAIFFSLRLWCSHLEWIQSIYIGRSLHLFLSH